MSKQLFFLLIGMTLVLGGCSLAPEYIQPIAPMQAEWPQGEAYQSVQTTAEFPVVTELGRQEFFTDIQLQQIMELALKNNRDLRLAALNVERARALYGIQRAELFPAVNVVGVGSKQRNSADLTTPGNPQTVEQYGVNLGVAAWEIDFFGRLRNLKDQALEAYLATDEARRSTQIALVGEIAKAYLTLAADEENRKLSQMTLAAQQDSYSLIQKSYDAGIVTELELRQAQIPLEVARGDIARYTQLVAQDKNALNLLVGETVLEELLPQDLSSITPPREISAGLNSEILLQRPDILAAEHQLKGAYASIGAARAAFFPRISLTTTVGTASDELSGLFGSGTDTWSFAPQISAPIFDARTWAAYRVSKTDREIALTQYEKAIQTAFRDVADTLAVQGTIDQQLLAQQALVTALAETYRLSEIRYTQGLDSYLGVLNAQTSRISAEQGLITLRLTKFANRVRLYTILGVGATR
ncbi:efflux transporter outer membrane subunit [uncultured Desulfuromusa sp.]|uniref:efflux transporter outer membrane subunit n=1 Tax=uncultured Desulfuromusa sp. TaxID=219183 RepID=UPI002AA73BBA|nr:efflux transporter outer membrane subunit [uncultured Desulfuromusa sp.]